MRHLARLARTSYLYAAAAAARGLRPAGLHRATPPLHQCTLPLRASSSHQPLLRVISHHPLSPVSAADWSARLPSSAALRHTPERQRQPPSLDDRHSGARLSYICRSLFLLTAQQIGASSVSPRGGRAGQARNASTLGAAAPEPSTQHPQPRHSRRHIRLHLRQAPRVSRTPARLGHVSKAEHQPAGEKAARA
ncbi:hypothetical protein SVAN01_11047 [Stagonosporopsis vannaccii]|nr:hypothetical protein SVAN01_11047 [Stagonosporopsis vannaccii]